MAEDRPLQDKQTKLEVKIDDDVAQGRRSYLCPRGRPAR